MTALNLPQPIGFVLGGGGSLGAMQVGMLQALWRDTHHYEEPSGIDAVFFVA